MAISINNRANQSLIPSWLKENCFRLNDEGCNLRNLNLNLRRLDSSSVLILSEALRKNKRIEALNMTSSLSSTQRQRDGMKILIPLAFALRYHVSLRTMYLSYNQLRDATHLAKTLEANRTSLTELYLDHNRLNVDTAVALSRALRHNNKLQILQLDSNNLGDEGGIVIAEALRENTGLKSLGLARNTLKSGAASALLYTFEHRNVSLQQLSLNGNPHVPIILKKRILFYVRVNRAGRYLLRDQAMWIHLQRKGSMDEKSRETRKAPFSRVMGGAKIKCSGNDEEKSKSEVLNNVEGFKGGLWPQILHGLEPDIVFYFLREKPSLVMSQQRITRRNQPTK